MKSHDFCRLSDLGVSNFCMAFVSVPRPKPLSTAVTKTVERRVNSQSALIMAVMDKVAEAEAASECGRRRLGDNQDGRLEMQADSEPVIEESLHQRDRALDKLV